RLGEVLRLRDPPAGDAAGLGRQRQRAFPIAQQLGLALAHCGEARGAALVACAARGDRRVEGVALALDRLVEPAQRFGLAGRDARRPGVERREALVEPPDA